MSPCEHSPKDVSIPTVITARLSPAMTSELMKLANVANDVGGPWPRLDYSMPNLAACFDQTSRSVCILGLAEGLLVFGSPSPPGLRF